MNKVDIDRIRQLCALIVVQRDRNRFLTLVEELDRTLSAKEQRLPSKKPEKRKSE